MKKYRFVLFMAVMLLASLSITPKKPAMASTDNGYGGLSCKVLNEECMHPFWGPFLDSKWFDGLEFCL